MYKGFNDTFSVTLFFLPLSLIVYDTKLMKIPDHLDCANYMNKTLKSFVFYFTSIGIGVI